MLVPPSYTVHAPVVHFWMCGVLCLLIWTGKILPHELDFEVELRPKSILYMPCAAANSRSYGHPITRIRSDIEPLITEPRDEDNDLKSVFDVGKLFNTAHSGVSSYAATSFGAENTLESNVVAHSGLSSYAAAGSGALNATENMVVSRSGMTSFAVANRFSTNAPQDTVTSHASQLPPFTPHLYLMLEIP
ncbi:hypothetical protein FXO37_26018 [Capsicum annuum]|nr:hypothetical protein FXO37_26018 [Capsicum annuum]